jgi:asparagine synthase (glutamine-hydrolysing)
MIAAMGRSAVIVRERVRGVELPTDGRIPRRCTEHEFDRLVGEAKKWPLDFVLLTMMHTQDGRALRLTCGRWGSAPIYLHAADGVLRGTWDVTKLYPYLRSTILDPGFVAQYLAILDYPYSRKTIFPEIAMLTERATASWSAPFAVPKIRYPSAEDHATAARAKPGTEVEGAMREILTGSMRRWLWDENEDIAVELSGGLDSTAVAAAAASLTTGSVRSYGMIMPGRPGVWQSRRRDAVIRRFHIRDRNFPCIDEPPFNPRSRRIRDDATVPWGEFYDEAVGVLLDLAREDGASLIFTGMGGDELCSYQPGEIDDNDRTVAEVGDGVAQRAGEHAGESFQKFLTAKTIDAFRQRNALIDDAPQSLFYTSALESAAAVSTLYLTHGIWPASPLVTPELVQFCRRLPFELRHERLIQRRLLTSYGLGRTVAYANPKRLEDFNDVMTLAMHKASVATIAPLFEDSRLAEQGYVDRSELVKAYRRARTGDDAYGDELLGVTVLELTLRAVESRRTRAPEPLPVGDT